MVVCGGSARADVVASSEMRTEGGGCCDVFKGELRWSWEWLWVVMQTVYGAVYEIDDSKGCCSSIFLSVIF